VSGRVGELVIDPPDLGLVLGALLREPLLEAEEVLGA